MSVKKGTTITDASGATYTVTGFHIKSQKVMYTLQLPGQEPTPGVMPQSQWKELAAMPNDMEAADIVNKASEPGNGADTAVAVAPVKNEKILIIKGMRFKMMNNEVFKISEYNRSLKKLVAVSEKTQNQQPFTLQELTNLIKDGHIKILS